MTATPNNPIRTLAIAALVAGAVGAGIWAAVSMSVRGEREVTEAPLAPVDPALLTWRQVGAFDPGVGRPWGVAVGGGRIYVAGDTTLAVFTFEGQRVLQFTLSGVPSCVAVGPNNRMAVGLGRTVAWLDRDGKATEIAPPAPKPPYFTSVLWTLSGLYAADSINAVVWRTVDEGKTWSKIDGRTGGDKTGFVLRSANFDIAQGAHGLLRIVNPGRLRVEAYTADGQRKFMWGKASSTVDGFGGCCNPAHIAIDSDGYVVTAEKGLAAAKVKVFMPDRGDSAPGALDSVVADASQFRDPAVSLDVAVDADGRVIVLELVPGGTVRIFERKPAGAERADDE